MFSLSSFKLQKPLKVKKEYKAKEYYLIGKNVVDNYFCVPKVSPLCQNFISFSQQRF